MKLLARPSALAALVATISCGPHWSEPHAGWYEPTDILVCVDLPERHLEAAHQAVVAWDTALRNWKRVSMVHAIKYADCDLTVTETDSWLPEDSASAGWTIVGGDEIFLVRGRYEGDVTRVLAHEIGHSLGAQHLDIRGSLMAPVATDDMPSCPDAATVAQVAAYHKAELSTLAWCSK